MNIPAPESLSGVAETVPGLPMAVFERQARLCQALADPKRLAIIHLLRNGEQSVGQLVAALGVRQPNVSQHLMILRDLGVVTARRAGNVMRYQLAHPAIGQACDLVRQVLIEQEDPGAGGTDA